MKKSNPNHKGFTLIELLVVIAIIGILASVVLSSLSSARAGARDTAMKQMIIQLASQAELYRLQNPNLAELRKWLIGRTHTGAIVTCASRQVGTISPFGAEFLSMCQSIERLMPVANNYYMYWGYQERIGNGPYSWRNDEYAFMVRLSNGDWFCANSKGVRQQGPSGHIGCRSVTL